MGTRAVTLASPTLTTVDQNLEETIAVAAETVLSQIDRPALPRPVVRTIKPVLVVRESTGPARA